MLGPVLGILLFIASLVTGMRYWFKLQLLLEEMHRRICDLEPGAWDAPPPVCFVREFAATYLRILPGEDSEQVLAECRTLRNLSFVCGLPCFILSLIAITSIQS